ncbi:MAG: hypothetical protein HY314_05190 [Acidobacteria bacterium]|nr:hypothetical protein [Acidobacteriota bacterium]
MSQQFKLINLEPDADGIHAIGPELWWREAWYFEFFDPASRIQFQAYQGVFPNVGKADLIFYIFKGGELFHRGMKMDYSIPNDIGAERLCFGPLKLDLIEPFQRWRLRYDSTQVQCDLTFDGLHAPFSWAESKLWMEQAPVGEQSKHFDQMGHYHGWITLDGEEFEISALGMRDRMCGWGARAQWRGYLIIWSPFSPEFVTNIAVQNFADGRQQLCGYIHRGDDRAVLKSAHIEIVWSERRWKSIETVHALITDVLGNSSEIMARPMGIIDTSHHWLHRTDHMLFSVAEYECGGMKGYGVLNWSFMTADDRPSVITSSL